VVRVRIGVMGAEERVSGEVTTHCVEGSLLRTLGLLLAPLALAACAGQIAPAPPVAPIVVVPTSPPKDDGKSSSITEGGLAHSAALEQLKVSRLLGVVDKQHAVRVLVPDARHWTRVKFFGVPTLMGLRYGKDHHAVIGVTVQHVDPNASPASCATTFEAWGAPLLDAFDVDVNRDATTTFPWNGDEAELHVSYAKTASLAMRDGFAVAYATYPAWKGACLIVGIAVPAHEDEARARAVRDRVAKEVLPKVLVLAKEEPKARE
jgi:hypothetical protein